MEENVTTLYIKLKSNTQPVETNKSRNFEKVIQGLRISSDVNPRKETLRQP